MYRKGARSNQLTRLHLTYAKTVGLHAHKVGIVGVFVFIAKALKAVANAPFWQFCPVNATGG